MFPCLKALCGYFSFHTHPESKPKSVKQNKKKTGNAKKPAANTVSLSSKTVSKPPTNTVRDSAAREAAASSPPIAMECTTTPTVIEASTAEVAVCGDESSTMCGVESSHSGEGERGREESGELHVDGSKVEGDKGSTADMKEEKDET